MDEGRSMLTEGQWYRLPDGIAVRVSERGSGTWYLMASDGTPAYVVFGGVGGRFHIRRLVYTPSVADDSGVGILEAVACDLTLEDLRLVVDE